MNVQSNNTATVIDPTKLKSHKNDILYRFNYVRDFLDFNENDIKAIKLSATILAPLVPQIVDLVYQKLFSFDVTKQIFLQRNEGFTGNIEKNLSSLNLSSDVIKFRKDMLSKYLVKLVTADYDEKFVNYLDWVGRIHTNTPLKKSKINVDYVHVNALFGFVSSALFQIVLDSNLSKKEQDSIVVAFNKLLWIQNDFFVKYYSKDSVEESVQQSKLSFKSHSGLLCCVGVGVAAVGVAIGKYLLK